MDRYSSHDFFLTLSSLCTHHIVAQGVARRVCIKTCSSTCHHVFERLLFPCFCLLPLSLVPLLFLSLLPVLCPELQTSMWSKPPSIKPNAHPQNEEYCPVAIYNPLTGYEPNQFDNQLDNSDYSESYAVIFQNESVDMDTDPSYSCDAELDDELTGKALSSPLFIHSARRTSEPETNLSLS